MSAAQDPPSHATPEEAFRWYLERLESNEQPDFEALVAANPASEAKLRELEQAWKVFERLGPRMGLSFRLNTFPPSVDSDTTLHTSVAARNWGSPSTAELLGRLFEHSPPTSRYRSQGSIGKGGMGEVIEVWDEDLRRRVALKRLHSSGDSARDEGMLTRFLEEAQVTAQLDHPGVVPVHELGVDSKGDVYFTMTRVRGGDLSEVLRSHAAGDPDWTRNRLLGVLVKVCEAMSYAHSKDVIHRDLKPANIMVGRFGEVYVMDWGLARVLGSASEAAAATEREESPRSVVESDRAESRRGGKGSTNVTSHGSILGTPCYMPPEQAAGELDKIDQRTDVYALGAILYELLTGSAPYAKGKKLHPTTVVAMILMGPPDPVGTLAKDCHPELIAICEKAMAPDPDQRYQDMSELLTDLRAFLDDRVVAAYEGGPLAELRKWMRRNKPLAAAIGAAILILVLATILSLGLFARAEANAREARAEEAKVAVLSSEDQLEALEQRMDTLWPLHPDTMPELEEWLEEARQFKERVSPLDGSAGILTKLEQMQRSVASEDGQPPELSVDELQFQRWISEAAGNLLPRMKRFIDPDSGSIAGVAPNGLPGIARRIELTRELQRASLDSAEAQALWSEARESAAAGGLYPGLDLKPQFGLLPLGPNAQGYLEFTHLPSGAAPERDEDGDLILSAETGIVLVLIPRGRARLPVADGVDPDLVIADIPFRWVDVEPFFLSKYELTQAQWKRITGQTPSELFGQILGNQALARPDYTRPVQMVSQPEATKASARYGLRLPTDIEWHRGAHGDVERLFFFGDEYEEIVEYANVLDTSADGVPFAQGKEPVDETDGFVVTNPVGALAPNDFGVHDILGNVWEWTATIQMEGGGIQETIYFSRGGCYTSANDKLLPRFLEARTGNSSDFRLGFRPARDLEQ